MIRSYISAAARFVKGDGRISGQPCGQNDGAALTEKGSPHRGTRKVLQEAGGQFIGLARTRRSADLPELWIV